MNTDNFKDYKTVRRVNSVVFFASFILMIALAIHAFITGEIGIAFMPVVVIVLTVWDEIKARMEVKR